MPNIVVLPGDHVGAEVADAAITVLKEVDSLSKIGLTFEYHDIGGSSLDKHGVPLTDEALNAAKKADGIFLGAVGGPKWATTSPRPEEGLLKLRKELNVWANIRPCSFASQSLLAYSPLKAEVAKDVNLIVVRELTGGVYFGDRKELDAEGNAVDIMPYSVGEVERITRLAAWLAKLQSPPLPITQLDKANVLATSRLWRKTVTDVLTKEHPEIKFTHQLIDSAAMILVKNPRSLNGIVLTENLFGDIISDESSVIPGSLGLLPSASLSGIPGTSEKVNVLVEPIHGSAPDIAGQGIANPIGAILSGALLLRWALGKEREAKAIEDAVKYVLDDKDLGGLGLRTKDLGGNANTKQVTEAIIDALKTKL